MIACLFSLKVIFKPTTHHQEVLVQYNRYPRLICSEKCQSIRRSSSGQVKVIEAL